MTDTFQSDIIRSREMEEVKGMNVMVECKNCKNRFRVGNDNITFDKHYKDVNGQSILLTYFDCPECKERHFVQIDNTHSREVKKKITKMFAKLSVMRSKNIQIPKQQQKKFGCLQNTLKMSRLQLMKSYDGSIVTDTETGETITLNFTMI